MRVDQSPLFVNLAATGAQTYVSSPVDIGQMANGSVQFSYTGTPTGTLTIEVSNDAPVINVGTGTATPTNWTPYPAATQAVAGAAGAWVMNLPDIGFRWLRAKYVNTSGTGTFSGMFCGKGV